MQVINIDAVDILAPPTITLIATVCGYMWSRTVRRGRPMTSFQRKMMWYGPMFILSTTYAAILHDQLAIATHWTFAWIAVIAIWGTLLALVAWVRDRNHPGGDKTAR